MQKDSRESLFQFFLVLFIFVWSSWCLAADKSAVGPSAISVPKGPGSIEGLGESFQPSLNSGTAKYGVTLQVPPGTAGQTPSLALSYEGGGGNGPLGLGWALPSAYIQVRSDKGIPTYGQNVGFARQDRFINEMKEELVPQSNGYWFCENEGAFVRYRFVPSLSQPVVEGHWEGTAPDGTRFEFGLTENGRIQDGTNAARVFCWLLEKETDTRGNTILYTYAALPGAQNTNQKYLTEIRYGPGGPPWQNFHFARFNYEDRPDWFEDGRAGFLVRTGKRLKSVVIGTQGPSLANHLAGDFNSDGLTDFLLRRYELGYLNYAGTNSHWSLLAKVQLVGADGVITLPAATYGYQVCNPPESVSAEGKIIGSRNEPGVVMDNPLIDLVDLNGDGLPDILETQDNGGAHRGYLNLGQTNNVTVWSAPQEIGAAEGGAWTYNLRSDITEGQSVHLADMDGDGSADLNITSFLGDVYYCANSNHLGWGAIIPMTGQDVAPPSPFGDDQTRTADLDFDKRMDIVQSLAGAYDIWFNLGNHTYSPRVRVAQNPGYDFSDKTVRIVDFNGDRVPDLASLSVSTIEVSAGLGYGRFAPAVTVAIPEGPLEDFQVLQAQLQDITGDGLPDLVIERATTDTLWYWINLGNYTFSPRKVITGMPVIVSVNAVRWADLNGNGATDLIYGDSAAGEGERMRTVDLGDLLNCGASPNVLTAVSNGIGGVTLIGYVSSTQFSVEDAAAGRPWPDVMPFPVQVIAAITNLDSLGHHYVTRFRYHDAYYDPVEKQFRGFARAEQVSVGDPSAPTLVSRSYFDTGRDYEPMKGKLLRLRAETEDGRVFTDSFTAWTVPPRVLMTGTNGQTVNYVNQVGATNLVLELGQGTPRRIESETDYDPFGNQTRAANYGIVEAGDRTAFDDERIQITEYAINTNAWILRAPKRQLVQDENGALIARSESFYDDETFSGNNFGSVTIGNLTLQRAWINPSNSTAFVRAARTRYDAYGNAIAVLDPLSDDTGNASQGHLREMTYDSRFHSYPVRETIHIGGGKLALVFRATYNEGLATMLSSTDFNSNTTTYAYDGLGRLTSVVKPYDTAAFPTTEYDYALAVPVAAGLVNFVETRQLDRTPGSAGGKRDHYLISRQFTDGLGRSLMSRSEAGPAPGQSTPRVAVSGAVLFNARQKPVRALNPFFTVQNGSLDQLLAFENIEAPGWQGQFHENGGLVSLSLASAHQTSTEYDATLRALRTTNPDGTRSGAEYEPLVSRSFDENDTDAASPHFNTPMVQRTDGLGRLIRVDELVRLNDDGTPSDAVNVWTTRYQYDLNDCLTRITDSQNNVKLMRYDGLKRKTFMNDPDCGISTNVYDEASNLIETVDAKSQRITYTFDGVNRILTEDYHDENSPEFSYQRSPDVLYHYDEPAVSLDQGDGTRVTARNVKGGIAYIEDTTGEEHTSFDERGRMEWTVKRILDPELSPTLAPDSSKLVAFKTTFKFDSMDRVTRMLYPDNDEVTYQYNGRSLLDSIGGGPTGSILSGLDYLPSGQQKLLNYGNGVRTTYAYDKRARLATLDTRHASTGAELVRFAYAFDNVSDIREIRDERSTSAVPATDKRRNSQTFAYDSLYRLTRVQYNLPTPSPENGGQINYRYDRLGNMIAQTSDITHVEKGWSVTDLGTMNYGGAAGRFNRNGRQPADSPGPHALTAITQPSTNNAQPRAYPYDANGNMTEIDGLRCTWDFLNRLVAVEDETMRAEYRYDFTGRRIIKRVTPRPAPAPAPAARPSASLYPGKHFEVRDHDQPTKYVFNGSTRVAHVTGSLSSNERIQRLRLWTGWNLISLAITAVDLATQIQQSVVGLPPVVGPIFLWKPVNGDYSVVSPGQTVPAGSVLWVKANTNATLAVSGAYIEPTNRPVLAGGHYLPSAGLEIVPLLGEDSAVGSNVSLAYFDPFAQHWEQWLPSVPLLDSAFPTSLPPGAALFARTDSPIELTVPDSALRIRYYYQDHLGSSSVMTDGQGALIEETAFFPFGVLRHEHRLRPVEEAYKFTQKERDRESGLHYFEARFLAGVSGRFVSADPKFAALETATSDPQELNLYAYARNNPVLYVDPTGLDGIPVPAESLDEIDVDATGEAIGDFLGSTWLGAAIKAPPRIKDAASFSGGIGDGIVDPIAQFGGINTLGLGFGRFTRLAFGINNVDQNSPDYGGGKVIGTLVTFATGGAEGVALAVARRAPAAAKAAVSASTVRQVADPLKGRISAIAERAPDANRGYQNFLRSAAGDITEAENFAMCNGILLPQPPAAYMELWKAFDEVSAAYAARHSVKLNEAAREITKATGFAPLR
jgi:RHS repeat-associated protein